MLPALEPDPKHPGDAFFARAHGFVAQAAWIFRGWLVTDAMDMGGITVRYAPGDAAVRAFLAGADALLMPRCRMRPLRGVARGLCSPARFRSSGWNASVRRILAAKARLGLQKNRLVDVAALNNNFGSVARQAESQEISDRGITPAARHAASLAIGWHKTRRGRCWFVCMPDPEPYPGEDLRARAAQAV